jgi:hypothetical protein
VDGWINNNWVVSLCSIVVGVAATPLLLRAWSWLVSRRGKLTGSYLSLTQVGDQPRILLEQIRCRQVGDRLYGRISARAEFSIGDKDWSEEVSSTAPASYRFDARLRERKMLLTYWSTARASANGGTMTMSLDDYGAVFRGAWCGIGAGGDVMSYPCIWFRRVDDLTRLSTKELAEAAVGFLRAHPNPWHTPDNPAGTQKMRYFLALAAPDDDGMD